MKITPYIRWMIRKDMPQVLEIENLCFEFPWPLGDDKLPEAGTFIHALRQRNCIGMVAEYDNHVIGFMVYELKRTAVHVLNFAVMPAMQGRGVGAEMVRKLKGKLSSQRRRTIVFETRESNLDCQLFLRAVGLKCVGVLQDFYSDTGETAYRFQYRYKSQGALLEASR